MRRARRRDRRGRVDDLIELTDGDTIDLRSDAADDYHCMTIHLNVPPVRDDVADAWEQAGSLIDYPADLEERRVDQRRDDLLPGHLSAAVLPLDDLEPH